MRAQSKGKLKVITRNQCYPLHQSPFYKLSSVSKLATLLETTPAQLKFYKKFDHTHYRIFTNEKGRLIQSPSGGLYVLHNRIASLLSRIQTPTWLHSFKKGYSYNSNALQHIHARQVITFDIKAFYQNITQDKVRQFFLNDLKCSKDIAYILSKLCCFDDHLPTGSQVSIYLNFLANIAMFNELKNLAQARQADLSVYADDITISGNRVDMSLYNTMEKVLIRHGYEVSKHKTQRFLAYQVPIITGLAISNSKLQPRNSFYESLRLKCEFLNRNMSLIDNHILEQEYNSLKGKNNYILSYTKKLPSIAKETELTTEKLFRM